MKRAKPKINCLKVQDGTQIISGDYVFYLLDTCGVPLDTINQELLDRNLAFDMKGFAISAQKSKNYSSKKLLKLFKANPPKEQVAEFLLSMENLIRKIYHE
jgi:alanyl-tRNA synthetase